MVEHDLACQGLQEQPWRAWCAEAAAEIARQGLPEPNPYPSKEPPEGWTQVVELDFGELPRRHHEWTRLQALDAALEFKLNLPSGQLPTVKNYKAFADGNNERPDIKVIQRYGGLGELLNEVSYSGWRDRAVKQQQLDNEYVAEAKAVAQTEERREQRGQPRTYHRDPEKRMRLLIALRDHGPLANRELVPTLGVGRMSVWKLTNELHERGLIVPTQQDSRSPQQRYQLTIEGREALNDEATLRERLARR